VAVSTEFCSKQTRAVCVAVHMYLYANMRWVHSLPDLRDGGGEVLAAGKLCVNGF